jgi:hypothetical protein
MRTPKITIIFGSNIHFNAEDRSKPLNLMKSYA